MIYRFFCIVFIVFAAVPVYAQPRAETPVLIYSDNKHIFVFSSHTQSGPNIYRAKFKVQAENTKWKDHYVGLGGPKWYSRKMSVAYGCIWYLEQGLLIRRIPLEELFYYDLYHPTTKKLLKQPYPRKIDEIELEHLWVMWPIGDDIQRERELPNNRIANFPNMQAPTLDFLPTGPTSGKLFLAGSQVCVWPMTARLSAEKRQWICQFPKQKGLFPPKEVERIERKFIGEFYTFSRGKNYFFLSRADGKLFISHPKTKKERLRTMTSVLKKNQQVIAVVTDVDNDRTLFFTKSQDDKKNGMILELGDPPSRRPFAFADLPKTEGAYNLRVALRYARYYHARLVGEKKKTQP